MAGGIGHCAGRKHPNLAYLTMPRPRPDILHCKGRLPQAFALQGHGNKPLTSPWASPKSEALFLGRVDQRNEKESILDFVYIRLVSNINVKSHAVTLSRHSFSAALLGLPKMLNESDIHAEYPADVDDENISERGFQSTLPGEPTRVSSALALFRVARVMSKVLEENYPAAPSHDLSLQNITALNDELDIWLVSLAPHLRLHFVQDKPSTDVVGSRSPLLVYCTAPPSIFSLLTGSTSLSHIIIFALSSIGRQ